MQDPNKKKRIADAIDKMVAGGASDDEIHEVVQSLMNEPDSGQFSDVTSGASSKQVLPRGASLAALAHGATLGGADEILGGIEGLNTKLHGGSFSEGYERGKAKVEGVRKGFEGEHHVGATALELAGGLAAPLPGAISKLGLIKGGAVIGGVGGALSADEGSRTSGALLGAGGGAALGGLLKGGGKLGYEVLKERGWLPAQQIEKEANKQLVQRFSQDGKNVERLVNEGAARARHNDGSMLLDQGGRNVEGLVGAVVNSPGKQKELIASKLTRRVRNQLPQLSGALERGAGKAKDIRKLAEEITAKQQEEAAPFYEAAHAHGVVDDPGVVQDAQLLEELLPNARAAAIRLAKAQGISEERLLGAVHPEAPPPVIRTAQSPAPSTREALDAFYTRSAKAASRSEGTPIQQMARAALERHGAESEALGGSPLRGAPREELPAPEPYQRPTVLYLDYLKQGVDDILQRAPEHGIGARTAAAIREVKNSMLSKLDEAVPDYGAARKIFAGHAESLDALEAGKNFLKEAPEEVAALKAKMTDSEREHYTLGQQDALRVLMEKVADSHDLTKKLISNPQIRAKIRTVFPDDASFMAFLRKTVNLRDQAGVMNRILGNSKTAERQTEIASMLGIDPASFAFDLATGNFGGAAKKGVSAILKGGKNYNHQKIQDALGRKLQVRPGTPEYDLLMQELAKLQTGKTPAKGLPADRLLNAAQGQRRLLPSVSLKNRTGAIGEQPDGKEVLADRIKTAATKIGDDVFEAPIHVLALEAAEAAGVVPRGTALRYFDDPASLEGFPYEHGFVTESGRFVSRDEADRIAEAAEQLDPLTRSLRASGLRKGGQLDAFSLDGNTAIRKETQRHYEDLVEELADARHSEPPRGHSGLKMLGAISGAGATAAGLGAAHGRMKRISGKK